MSATTSKAAWVNTGQKSLSSLSKRQLTTSVCSLSTISASGAASLNATVDRSVGLPLGFTSKGFLCAPHRPDGIVAKITKHIRRSRHKQEGEFDNTEISFSTLWAVRACVRQAATGLPARSCQASRPRTPPRGHSNAGRGCLPKRSRRQQTEMLLITFRPANRFRVQKGSVPIAEELQAVMHLG